MAIPDITPEITAFQDAAYGEEVRSALVQLARKLCGVITSDLDDMSETWDSYKTYVDENLDDFNTDLTTLSTYVDDTVKPMMNEPWNKVISRLTQANDMNDIIRGLYWYNTDSLPTNAPSNIYNGIVLCFGNGDTYKYQLAVCSKSTVDTDEHIFIRTKGSGYDFTLWREIHYLEAKDFYDIISFENMFFQDALNGRESSCYISHSTLNLTGLQIMDDDGNVGYNLNDFPLSNYQHNTTHPGLSITDENGNVIAELCNGKTNTLAGKTISFIGDSISTFSGYIPSGYAAFYPKSYLDDVRETWWYQLLEQTGMRLIQNCSWSGSRVSGDSASTTSAAAASSDKRIADVAGPNNETPDFIVILISVNDFNGGVALGDWSYSKPIPSNTTTTTITDAYMLMLYKLHVAYPTSHIFCCTICPHLRSVTDDPPYPTTHETSGVMETELNQRIRDIAKAMNCGIIDFATSGLTIWNQNIYMGDSRLHPNMLGADIMTNIARSTLERYNNGIYIESGV